MQVRITFNRAIDEEDRTLIYLLIDVFLERIDQLLYRTPDYVIRGKYRLTITFYGLSKREAEIILKTARAEIIEDGIVKLATPINSSTEEDLGPYMFIRPEYKKGVKEDLEEKRGYGIDVKKFIGLAVMSSIKVFIHDNYKEYDDMTAPLTTMAIVMDGAFRSILAPEDPEDPEYMENYLAQLVTNEPMYKERPLRRPRRPRKPRNRSGKRTGGK